MLPSKHKKEVIKDEKKNSVKVPVFTRDTKLAKRTKVIEKQLGESAGGQLKW